MADAENVGTIEADIRLRIDKLEADFATVRGKAVKAGKDLEDTFQRAKISINTSNLNKSLSDVQAMQSRLKSKLEEKIMMNADMASINKTKSALQVVESQLIGIKKESQQVSESFNLWGKITGVLTGFGIGLGIQQLFQFGKQVITSGAELEELKSHFAGTEEQLELFRVATAHTVEDANLIRFSNQALDLGVTLDEQSLFFAIALDAAHKYGIGVEDAMGKVIMATEGNMRALKAVGVQKEVFKELVKDLTREFANQGFELDAETMKEIRIQAIMKATGKTIEEVRNIIQSSSDKVKGWGVLWDGIQRGIGSFVLPVLFALGDHLQRIWKNLIAIGQVPKNILSSLGVDISDEALGVTPKSTLKKSELAPEGSMERLAQDTKAANQKKIKVVWEVDKKSQEEIESHITTLKNMNQLLVPNSPKWTENFNEMEKLDKLLKPKDKSSEVTKQRLEAEKKLNEAIAKEKDEAIADDYLRDKTSYEDKAKVEIDSVKAQIKMKTMDSKAGAKEIESVNHALNADIEKLDRDYAKKSLDAKISAQQQYINEQQQISRTLVDSQIRDYKLSLTDYKAYLDKELDLYVQTLEEKNKKIKEYNKKYPDAMITPFDIPSIKAASQTDNAEQTKIYGKSQQDQVLRLKKDMLESAVEFGDALNSAIDKGGNHFISFMSRALNTATKIADILDKVGNGEKSETSGILAILASGIKLIVGGSTGGTFGVSSNRVKKMAGGGGFTVPSGYNNDSYPMFVQSGESVKVYTPAQQSKNMQDYAGMHSRLDNIHQAIRILNKNTIENSYNQKEKNSSLEVNGRLDGRDISLSNKKATQVLNRIS
jgi:hypothetical protein